MAAQRATEDALALLHALVARHLASRIERGVTVVTKDGDRETVDCSTADLAAAIKFLKDNGIDAPAPAVGDTDKKAALAARLAALAKQADEDEEGANVVPMLRGG